MILSYYCFSAVRSINSSSNNNRSNWLQDLTITAITLEVHVFSCSAFQTPEGTMMNSIGVLPWFQREVDCPPSEVQRFFSLTPTAGSNGFGPRWGMGAVEITPIKATVSIPRRRGGQAFICACHSDTTSRKQGNDDPHHLV